ncbi:MAG: hypothetical protein M1817_006451 [Caeruleum heppii]|nr:MAG: hypothetical protein M1817_006451 [Caeruleum heppii]
MSTPDRVSKGVTVPFTDSPSKGQQNSDQSSLTHQGSKPPRADGKIELGESDCWDKLGYSFSSLKKWSVIAGVFGIQTTINFNASIYANAVSPISKEFGVSEQAARVGQAIFLIAYGFGCEFWAPWSEDFGRWPVQQMSLFLVNIWQLPCALAPNFATIIVGRFLGGVCSAGGSVTLGIVADMWGPNDQQFAVAFVVLSSVMGSVIGAIVGGPVQKNLDWRWIFWLQLIVGVVVQIWHWTVPETRSTILIDREAKRRRKMGEKDVYGPNELKEHRITPKEVGTIFLRPFIMFVREPIVLCLSLLSGFSDALIFTFLESYKNVYEQWGFGPVQISFAFFPIVIGYLIAYAIFIPWIFRDQRIRRKDPDALQPECRLRLLLWLAPLEPIGLFGFAWTSLGPPQTHWIGPMIFSALIAIANYAIYMTTIDYMVECYGPYSASATGGNDLARDVLAGVSAMYAIPFYTVFPGRYKLEWPSTILGIIGILVVIPVFIFYWKGPAIRAKSPFAQTLASDRRAKAGRSGANEKDKEKSEPEP